jgi:hypothetical protein
MFGIDFFIKTDMDVDYFITRIHHRKFYDISFGAKTKIYSTFELRVR